MTSLIQSAVSRVKHQSTNFDLEDSLEQFSVVDPIRESLPFQNAVRLANYGIAEKGDPNVYLKGVPKPFTPKTRIVSYVAPPPPCDVSMQSFLYKPRGNSIHVPASGRWSSNQ